jgi:hypothetical protein
MICEKAVIYLYKEHDATNLASASDVTITAFDGSAFDCNQYHAVLCDECLDKAIQRRRVTFVGQINPL